MLRSSASFVLDNITNIKMIDQQQHIPKTTAAMDEIRNNNNSSTYYETRAEHHSTAVTLDWLAQAQAALPHGDPERLVSPHTDGTAKTFDVTDDFNYWRKKPDLAEAVAAIMALAAVIKRSQASTMMELEIELKNASDTLKLWDETSISLSAGCDLFMRYVTRTSALEYEDFHTAKSRLIERGERFGEISLKARKTIAMLGQDFIVDGSKILVHGFSRVVLALLKMASSNGKHFSVFCTEGRPDNTGIEMTKELVAVGVPVKLIIDSAVAYTMEKVDLVLFGADGVVESGGIINMMGTYQTALVAHSMNKPVYVAAESYKDILDLKLTKELVAVGVPVKLIIDSAVAYTMEKVDLVLFGADGVVESGGIINMMGTYQTALVAHSMNKPVYVAAESYKFARLYPLDQTDMSPAPRSINFGVSVPPTVDTNSSARDYTPPQYLTLLFTDLGVLTPSAISDELIKLYL